MSICQTTKSEVNLEDCPLVLARGFLGRPSRLHAIAQHGDIIEVANDSAFNSIGYPAKDVFVFEPDMFTAITAACQESRECDVDVLWAKCERFQMEHI